MRPVTTGRLAAFASLVLVAMLAMVEAEAFTADRRTQRVLAAVIGTLLLLAVATVLLMQRRLGRELAERLRIERELRASEARFAGILSIAADAIISADAAGAIVNFNQGAEQMFGYAASEVVGQSLDLLLPARHVTAHHDHVRAFSVAPESARRMEERREVAGRRRDGSEFPADISISKLPTPTGVLFTAVVRDVTVQRRQEHHEHTLAVAGTRLAGSLDLEATILAVVQLPVHAIGDWCLVDLVERRDGAQPSLRRIASADTDLARHTALRSIEARGLHWDSPAEAVDVIRTGRARLQPALTADWLEARTEDAAELQDFGQLEVRSCVCVPLIARDEIVGALTVGRRAATMNAADLDLMSGFADIAARAITSAELYRTAQQALHARDEVLAVVSHDLRTPASAITMCARTLLDHPPASAPELRALAETVLESADWMGRLMQDLLDAASIDAGRLAIAPEPQDLRAVLRAAADAADARAVAAAITLTVDVPDNLPAVLIDRDRTLQALANLISNALRFTARGGELTLAAVPGDDAIEIQVRDTGTGIPPDHLPHLFDRFWQARQRGIGRGTGLGLAIVKGIVEAQSGRIRVESRVGVGTTFSFTVPVA
jgi:PAS domain S-box-containing protein